MSVLNIFLHIGAIIQSGKDVQQAVANLITRREFIGCDWKKVLEDLEELVRANVINLPGIPDEQIISVLDQLEETLGRGGCGV